MITVDSLAAMIAESRETYRAFCASYRGNVETLETIYRETIERKPTETVKRLVQSIGYTAAVETVASLINRHSDDGRISRRSAAWAASIETALDQAAAEQLWIYTDTIHKSHLEQLAGAMMQFSPEPHQDDETTEAPEAPEALPAFHADRIQDGRGNVFPAVYHRYGSSIVIELDTGDGKTATVTVDSDNAYYFDALAALTESERLAAAAAEAEKQRRREERRAAAPAEKLAHGPVPEKTFAGETIWGNGWKIEFSVTYDRTRIIFDSVPTDAARDIVKAAGFFWSPTLKSWNRGLNWKSYRAALQVQETFCRMTEAPCKAKRRSA